MDFKTSLDRYLTTPPEDNYGDFCEAVYDNYSPNFWREVYEVPVDIRSRFENSEIETKWLEKLFKNGIEAEQASKIIERAHKLFIKTKFKYRKFKR